MEIIAAIKKTNKDMVNIGMFVIYALFLFGLVIGSTLGIVWLAESYSYWYALLCLPLIYIIICFLNVKMIKKEE